MSETHRRPSMPRVLWLERDRVPPPPPPPPPPEPPLLFRPKGLVREKLFPPARPIARGIVRVRHGEGVRLELRISPPEPRPSYDEDEASVPVTAPGRDWLRVGSRRGRAQVMISQILAKVAAHYGVEPAELLAHRRTAALVIPRQVAMYLAKSLTTRSLPDIGRRFGGRDHTTILHGVRKITALLQRDAALAEDVAELTERLLGGREGDARGEHPSRPTQDVGTSG